MLISSRPVKDVFYCPEESNFYSQCLESLVLNEGAHGKTIIEFGAGDGTPVINSLMRTRFDGIIHGFELNELAWKTAKSNIQEYELSAQYIIHNTSFFEASLPKADYLISNPPYLPAPDENIYQPLLHGGTDGSKIAKRLLSLDYENVLLMLSSYSNPEGFINYAIMQGYSIANFIVSPLNFGYYSSEPKVKNTIRELREKKMAFYSGNIYLLAGVLFKKQHKCQVDLSTELIQIMTSL
ncbi:class I SAM-dependent methyltransferase [Coleofasciculus sp. FACHB-129]|uniref:N5-glutamine methyltransferase family protein n=1 Tax=Cyanophyceae TaxID=3028117 RepID=UPI001686CF15|nr:class I SAM-dependent methyltransferase [Coleofasciculus sp. FACHB-129]MBD1897142.1 class I SAM-dependent methyltransferase [Coleofasciculus sp. FACHB-129]